MCQWADQFLSQDNTSILHIMIEYHPFYILVQASTFAFFCTGTDVPRIWMSCPSGQWHRTGSSWSPVWTLPVAPLCCDLGFVQNSCGNKDAANLCPMGKSSRWWNAPSQRIITKNVSYVLSAPKLALSTINFIIISNDWFCMLNIFSIALNRKHIVLGHCTKKFQQYLLLYFRKKWSIHACFIYFL